MDTQQCVQCNASLTSLSHEWETWITQLTKVITWPHIPQSRMGDVNHTANQSHLVTAEMPAIQLSCYTLPATCWKVKLRQVPCSSICLALLCVQWPALISHCNQSSLPGVSRLAFNSNVPTTSTVPANETQTNWTRGQSNLTKSASRGAHSPVRGHPRNSKFVPLNSWGRVSY